LRRRENQGTASYARRSAYGSIRGRGFNSRRLHEKPEEKSSGFFHVAGVQLRLGCASVAFSRRRLLTAIPVFSASSLLLVLVVVILAVARSTPN
jgi:hypothetical protein